MDFKSRLFRTVLVLWALSLTAIATVIRFNPAVTYPVGTAPVAVTAGDFNRDGKPDLAVANSGIGLAGDDGGLSILLGNGDGTFQTATNLNAGKNPGTIAATDLNGDGRVDLVVTNGDSGGGQVGVLLGNGDGTFHSAVNYGAGNGLNRIALGDFNGDLRPDIVVANALDGTVSILLGNGDGSFQPHVDYPIGGPAANIAVGDLNGDRKADLAMSVGHDVVVLIGNGDGTFQPSVPYFMNTPFGPSTVAIGDFNSDGKADLIADVLVSVSIEPPFATRRLDLLVGNGDGTFQLISGIAVSVGSGYLTVADFDGDGKLDVALGGITFLPGNGDGTLQAPVAFPTIPTGTLLATDLNSDKAPDLLIPDQANNLVAVVLNAGTDFSVSTSPVSPATIVPGQRATSTLSLSLLNAFDNPVSLSCSVQPAQAGAPSCSVSPNSVTFDDTHNATAQLTITADTSAALLTQPPAPPGSQPSHWPWLPITGLALAGVALPRKRAGRRRWFTLVAGGALFAGLVLQAACGGGGPKAQAYTITVTGTSGVTQHSAKVSLTVQ